MIHKKKNAAGLSAAILVAAVDLASAGQPSPIPSAPMIGTWVYNTTFQLNAQGNGPQKTNDVDDLWVNTLSCFNGLASACQNVWENENPNQSATTPTGYMPPTNNNPITQVIYYGGDLEAYCDGTGQPAIAGGGSGLDGPDGSALADGVWACTPNSFYTSYYGPYMGIYKLGDPTVDTSAGMKSDLSRWAPKDGKPIRTNSFTIKNTCEVFQFTSADCKIVPQNLTSTTNFWNQIVGPDIAVHGGQAGYHTTSGFRAASDYANTYTRKNGVAPVLVADIDGRLDVGSANPQTSDEVSDIVQNDYLDGLNLMGQADASALADFVAKNICADDNISGVQFDLEPFDLTGQSGRLALAQVNPNPYVQSAVQNSSGTLSSGQGQLYFYQRLAADFAGWYATPYAQITPTSPTGINNTVQQGGGYSDPLHCVDRAHPNGRFFSVFTFASHVTPTVINLFKQFNNGIIVDSLYDLTTSPSTIQNAAKLTPNPSIYTTTVAPGGTPTCPTTNSTTTGVGTYPPYNLLVRAEINAMKGLGVPFMFGLPLGASAHEFEESDKYTASGGSPTKTMTFTTVCLGADAHGNQGSYVTAAMNEIVNAGVIGTPNYKGVAVYGWSQQSWWADASGSQTGNFHLMPDYPNVSSLKAFATGHSLTSLSARRHN